MQRLLLQSLTFITQLLFKTRPTEAVVEILSMQELYQLARYDGSLPYHDKKVRALVWELKYYADSCATELAGEYLAELLVQEATETIGVPLLLPMPMHPERKRERGHNQTEVLCKAALPYLGNAFDYNASLLVRARHTKPQQGLERHVRLKNLESSMRVVYPELVEGRACIVVDDVTTTGASFAEAKRALKAAGAREVRTVALAQS